MNEPRKRGRKPGPTPPRKTLSIRLSEQEQAEIRRLWRDTTGMTISFAEYLRLVIIYGSGDSSVRAAIYLDRPDYDERERAEEATWFDETPTPSLPGPNC